jgi:hypothetical protein
MTHPLIPSQEGSFWGSSLKRGVTKKFPSQEGSYKEIPLSRGEFLGSSLKREVIPKFC